MFGNDMMKMMKEAGKLQSTMKAQQKKLGTQRYTGEAAGGMVKATVNGLLDVLNVDVEEGAYNDLGRAAVLELITGALNAAMKKARDEAQGGMQDMMQNLQGLFGDGDK